MTNFLNWDWRSKNVQSELYNGKYISAESALLLAGPSRLGMLTSGSNFTGSSNSLIPIGLIQNFSLNQALGVTRLFEIGSKRSYFIRGRQMANITLSRVQFFGPNLLRLMYPLVPQSVVGHLGAPLNIDPDRTGGGVAELAKYSALFGNTPTTNPPGHGSLAGESVNRDFWVNLTSEVFNTPTGLAVIYKSSADDPYGAMYLEDVTIESYQTGIDSNSVIITEAISAQIDRVVTIRLISRALTNN